MFAFALAVGFRDGNPSAPRAAAMLDGWPIAPTDGRAEISSPHAAAGVLRWAVTARDRLARPIWDQERQLLFAGDVRLYNRNELQRELELTAELDSSDLDLAWRAYLRWGEDSPRHLVGDFAFAVWNERSRSLFAARDQLGVRPLFYKTDRDGALVASDVRQLLTESSPASRLINPQAILERFCGRPRSHGLTFFRNIRSLPLGHAVTIDERGSQERRYWIPPTREAVGRSYADTCAELRELFMRAVRDRLESEYPIIAHSSGGFDSSAILMAADAIYREGPASVPLVMASATTLGMPCDDSRYMDAVARRVRFEGVRWDALSPNMADVERPAISYPGLRRGVGGGPRGDMALARERGARVLLGGMGGDTVTFAFGVLRDMVRRGLWMRSVRVVGKRRGPRAAASLLGRSLLGFLSPTLALRIVSRLETRSARAVPSWMGPELRSLHPPPPEQLDFDRREWRSHTACELWGRITSPLAGYSASSAVIYGSEEAVEVRLPFLDVRLVDRLLEIPWRDRIPRGGNFRSIGRDALGPLLPDEFRERHDQGSWTAVWTSAARSMLPALDTFLTDGRWLSAPYVEKREARRMFDEINTNPGAESQDVILVAEFGVLEAWLRRVFDYDTHHVG